MRAISKFLMAGAAAAVLSMAASAADAAVYIGLRQAGVNGGAITQVATGALSAMYSGSYGSWLVNNISGTDTGAIGDHNDLLGSNSFNAKQAGPGGPLEVFVTITDYNEAPQFLWSGLTSNSLSTGFSLTLTTYVSAANELWGGTQLATQTFTNPSGAPGVGIGTFNFTTPFWIANTGDYSLTARYVIDGPSSGSANATINIEGPIPEPSTWALMILGFGSAGAMLRSRRRLASVAA